MTEEKTYIGNDKKDYSFDSEKNIKIIKKVVKHEVLCDMTSIIEYFFDNGLSLRWAPIDDTMLLDTPEHFTCPYCGELLTDENEMEITEEDCNQFDIEIDKSDLEFPYTCPVCGAQHHREEDARYCCCGSTVFFCGECGTIMSPEEIVEDNIPTGASEWLAVSEWLGKKLASKGESVLKTLDGTYVWGRRFSDDVELETSIRSICYDAKILEGQDKEVKV